MIEQVLPVSQNVGVEKGLKLPEITIQSLDLKKLDRPPCWCFGLATVTGRVVVLPGRRPVRIQRGTALLHVVTEPFILQSGAIPLNLVSDAPFQFAANEQRPYGTFKTIGCTIVPECTRLQADGGPAMDWIQVPEQQPVADQNGSTTVVFTAVTPAFDLLTLPGGAERGGQWEFHFRRLGGNETGGIPCCLIRFGVSPYGATDWLLSGGLILTDDRHGVLRVDNNAMKATRCRVDPTWSGSYTSSIACFVLWGRTYSTHAPNGLQEYMVR